MNRRNSHKRRVILFAWFVLYILIVVTLMFFIRTPQVRTVNLKPFNTIPAFWSLMFTGKPGDFFTGFINVIGNVLFFIPLGFFLPSLFRAQRNFFVCLITSALIIAGLEALQYLTKLGTADIDDLILNLAGVIPGYLSAVLVRRKRHHRY